jgi:hypothetical protein
MFNKKIAAIATTPRMKISRHFLSQSSEVEFPDLLLMVNVAQQLLQTLSDVLG